MQAYEAAKKLEIPNKEFLAKYGLKSHMSKVPDDLVAELFGEEKKIETQQPTTETVDSAETDVVEVEVKETCPYTTAQIELGIRCLGGKAPQWKWRHMLDG